MTRLQIDNEPKNSHPIMTFNSKLKDPHQLTWENVLASTHKAKALFKHYKSLTSFPS